MAELRTCGECGKRATFTDPPICRFCRDRKQKPKTTKTPSEDR